MPKTPTTTAFIPDDAKELAALAGQGEGSALEFKRSTGELKEGVQRLCAFLNGDAADLQGTSGFHPCDVQRGTGDLCRQLPATAARMRLAGADHPGQAQQPVTEVPSDGKKT